MPTPKRQAAPRPALAAADVLRTAVGIADAEGIDAVSMRRLAREHAVTPMALYWHFPGKEHLLEAMAESVVTEAELADDREAPWDQRFRAALESMVRVLRAHPWMGRLLIERIVPTPHYLAALETMLDSTRAAGLTPRLGALVTQQAVEAVVVLVEYAPRPDRETPEKAASRAAVVEVLTGLDAEEYPNIRAAVGPLTTPDDPDEYLRLGIDLVVGGIRAVADPA